jgi:predicted  nucleic acid-binding Zn-ribbon protein
MDQVQRFMNVQEKIKTLSGEKIRIDERYKAETEKLKKLIEDIQQKGYDPTKLAEIKETKEKELEKSLSELEKTVQDVSEKLKKIEEQNAVTNS